MPPIRPKDLTMPITAFGMVIILLTYIRYSIGESKQLVKDERAMRYAEVLEQRRRLGLDNVKLPPREGKEEQ